MAKVNLKKIVKTGAKIAAPIVIAAVIKTATGGKLDLKSLLLDAAQDALTRARTPAVPR